MIVLFRDRFVIIMRKLFALFGVLFAAAAFAEGYQVNLQSTRQAGMGHVGTA